MSPLRRTLIIAFRISLALVALAVLNVRAEADSAAGEDVYFEGTLVDTWSPDWQATANTRVGCNWFGNRSHCQWGSSLFAENLREQCIIHYSHIDQWATELAVDVCLDYEDFYSCRGLALQGVGLGIAAVMANTSIDQEFQDWHDADVKSKSSDKLSGAFKWLGEGYITIPVCAGAALLSLASDDVNRPVGAVGNWGERCIRAYAVGGPSLLVLKYFLNGSRPEDEIGSTWRFFGEPRSGGAVSGHAFVGAIPLITAAKMTDNCLLKAGFYTLSALPAWSRINDRMHYLSQAMFGWWLAYLAVDAVHRTELFKDTFVILPHASPDGAGVQAILRW